MYLEVVVYAAVISSAVCTNWTIALRNHLVVYLFVSFANHLILMKVV